MSTTVTYKGDTLATVSNNTKTLKTAGKYMEGDVVLTDVSAGVPNVWQDENGYVHLDNEGGAVSWETVYNGNVEIYSSSPNYFQIIPYTTAFEANQTYRVTWGQTQYLCNTIVDPTSLTYDGYLIGNLNIVGAGTDTGEPFIIYRNSATELTGGTNQSTGTVSLKIELQHQSGSSISVEPLSVTQNGTYTAPTGKAYSPVAVNVSGDSTMLKMGVLRNDAELINSYSYDKYIVADEHLTIPSYSTSVSTLKASETLASIDVDINNYDYYVLERFLAIPKFSIDTIARGRQIYFCYVHNIEYIAYPYSCVHQSMEGNDTTSSAIYSMLYVYYPNSSNASSTPQSTGAHFQVGGHSFTESKLTIASPQLRIRGSSTFFTTTYWDALEDIRYQYVIEVYRAPKGNLNFDGFNHRQNLLYALECANSASGDLT